METGNTPTQPAGIFTPGDPSTWRGKHKGQRPWKHPSFPCDNIPDCCQPLTAWSTMFEIPGTWYSRWEHLPKGLASRSESTGQNQAPNDIGTNTCHIPPLIFPKWLQRLSSFIPFRAQVPSFSIASFLQIWNILMFVMLSLCIPVIASKNVSVSMSLPATPLSLSLPSVAPSRWPTSVSLAVILPYDKDKPYSFHKVHPAMEIAKEKVINNSNLLPGVSEIKIYGGDTGCSTTAGPLASISMVDRKLVDVFFGPFCSYVVSPVAKYCNQWHIPLITTGAPEIQFDNKGEYKQLTRVQGPYNKASGFVGAIFEHFGWGILGFLYHDVGGTSDCYHQAFPLFRHLEKNNVKSASIVFDENKERREHWKALTGYLREMSQQCRGKVTTLCSEGICPTVGTWDGCFG